jgi:hypothetical protein
LTEKLCAMTETAPTPSGTPLRAPMFGCIHGMHGCALYVVFCLWSVIYCVLDLGVLLVQYSARLKPGKPKSQSSKAVALGFGVAAIVGAFTLQYYEYEKQKQIQKSGAWVKCTRILCGECLLHIDGLCSLSPARKISSPLPHTYTPLAPRPKTPRIHTHPYTHSRVPNKVRRQAGHWRAVRTCGPARTPDV